MVFWIVAFFFMFTITAVALGWLFLTGIGTEALTRWKNKALFKTGGYTNALIFTKDGLVKEVFAKNVDGKFRWQDDPYTRVPKLSFIYKGMPTLCYVEGSPSPLDIFNIDTDELLRANEMDTVMFENQNFDFKDWFNKNIIWVLLGAGVLALLLIASIYFGYSSWEMLRDGAVSITSTSLQSSSVV
jgi:hypothetical protein